MSANANQSDDLWIKARADFIRMFGQGLDETDRQILETSTAENFLSKADILKERLGSSNMEWTVRKLKPLVDKLEQYGCAFDAIAGTFPLALAPIWGSIRILLQVRYYSIQPHGIDLIATFGARSSLPGISNFLTTSWKHLGESETWYPA